MARRDQQLYKDPEDQMIGGVCSGLAHYFDIDTTLVRVLFAVLLMAGGGGLVGYLALWYVLDDAPEGYWDELPGQDVLDLSEAPSESTPA